MSDLHDRARKNSEGFVVPDEWGEQIELEVDEFFDGRHRSWSDEGKSGAWLLWDGDGEPCFVWGNYRLRQAYEREKPNTGDRTSIFRGDNYSSKYDEPGEATGLGYGAACEPCSDPLPQSPDETGGGGQLDDIPFR
jgi:hypothetical protein